MTVDKSASRVQRMFAEIAERYDLLNHLLSAGIDRYWRWRTARLTRPGPGEPVLDVCSGTGDLALAYWRAGRRRTEVVAADFCLPMLALGREKVRQAKAGARIALVAADTERLPFDDGRFQVVSVAFGLRNVSDTDRGLREMVRVCRPGGRVVVLEFSMPRNWAVRAMYGWYFRHILPRVGQALAKNRQAAYNYLPASVGAFPQDEALAARMCSAGLARVRYRRMTCGIVTLYVGEK